MRRVLTSTFVVKVVGPLADEDRHQDRRRLSAIFFPAMITRSKVMSMPLVLNVS